MNKSGTGAAGRTSHSGIVLGAGRSADVVAFDDSVVTFFIEAADLLGVPKSVAAIYGICFASPQPLSFSEIHERLDISSGSISQGLRVLREVGALKVAGSRFPAESHTATGDSSAEYTNGATSGEHPMPALRSAARYAPDLELRNLVMHWLETRLQSQLSAGHVRLQEIKSALPQGLIDSYVLEERFTSLITWHEKARALLPVAKTFLKLT